MAQLTVASLNTRGTPVFGSHLNARYAAIGAAFEASSADVVNLQEVLTYYHLRRLLRAMPSYRHHSYRMRGGLLTLSRRPHVEVSYRRFPGTVKGMLTTSYGDLTILNTHLTANRDGDWSETNRHHAMHLSQLTALAGRIAQIPGPTIVSGDFNVARDSTLYNDFITATGLIDAFGPTCPPTFHQSYLPAGKTPHCIDFLLLSDPALAVETATLTFTLGDLSDHLGLEVRVSY
ncbi:endonuclease/exonuclease/phosphatase family protein [Kribbella sp. NPDC055071]